MIFQNFGISVIFRTLKEKDLKMAYFMKNVNIANIRLRKIRYLGNKIRLHIKTQNVVKQSKKNWKNRKNNNKKQIKKRKST